MRFLLDVHKVSSLMLHQSLLERVVTDEKGVDVRSPATFSERYTLLVEFDSLYSMFLRWLLAKYPEADVAGLAAWERAFYALPTIQESMNGLLKSRCP